MLLIGQLSQATGLSRETLRFYEREGLIRAQRMINGYRCYVPEAVELVQYIRTAQQLGFTLSEIRHKLPQVQSHADSAAQLTAFLAFKLQEIDERIVQLQALRQALAQRIGQECPMRPAALGQRADDRRVV